MVASYQWAQKKLQSSYEHLQSVKCNRRSRFQGNCFGEQQHVAHPTYSRVADFFVG